MNSIISLHDKREIERILRSNVYLHLYSIGDLDEFFWPHTVWYTFADAGGNGPLVLLYIGGQMPTVLALNDDTDALSELLSSVRDLLPVRFYAHLSPGVDQVLRDTHLMEDHGNHYKMALIEPYRVEQYETPGTEALGLDDQEELLRFYESCYPGNWFDPRMLETGQYVGIREEGELVSVAGIHVYSRDYGVAALGNIATRPSRRNRGLAKRVTARLCRMLIPEVAHIGLNVKADNTAAVSSYAGLGFAAVASYREFVVERR